MYNSEYALRRVVLSVAVGVLVCGILAIGLGTLAGSASGLALDGSTKSAAPASVYPGDLVTFTIVVSNSAAGETTATVLDPCPTGLKCLSGTGPGGLLVDTGGLTWTGTLTSYQAVTLTLQTQVEAGGLSGWITNTAVISDGITAVEKSAGVAVHWRVYLPIIMRRWPPIPYAAVLNPINNPTYGDTYAVTWQAADLADSYVLQEDDNAGFSSPVEYSVAALSKAFAGKLGGRYYYRVRGVNTWGYGEWSNVESTLVGYFFDDFSNPASGWLVANDPLYNLGYVNGEYGIYVPLDFRGGGNVDTWFDQPAVLAPVNPPSGSNYCVSVDVRFAQAGWWAERSLIFGASADKRTLYRLATNANGDWAVNKYINYTMPYGGIHGGDNTIIDWHDQSGEYVNPGDAWNHLKVIVSGTSATFYINGNALDFAMGLNDLPSLNRVGFLAGPYEVTPVDTRFDNFMWSTDITQCP